MKSFLLIVLSLIFFSCNKKQKPETEQIIITSPNFINNQTEDYEKLFKNVDYIPLETNPHCLISRIDQLYVGAENIFVLDGMQKNIFKFSLEGKFINRIGATGKGPGEFLNPVRFVIDEKQNIIHVNDRRLLRILRYRLDGEFIDEIRTNVYFSQFLTAENNGYWIYMVNEKNGLDESSPVNFLKINEHGKVVKKVNGLDYYPLLWCNGTVLSDHQSGPESSFVIPLNENIYSFKNGSIEQKYKIDFGPTGMDENELKKFSFNFNDRRKNFEMANKLWTKYARGYHSFIETDNWIYFTYSLSGHGRIVLYNKKTNITTEMPQIVYNKNGWETFFQCQFAKGNFLYSAVYPLTLKNIFNSKNNKYTNSRLTSFTNTFRNISNNDNPIIIFYELKN